MSRDRVRNQPKQGASLVVHPLQQSTRARNASSILQWRSHKTHEQSQIPWSSLRQNADVQDAGRINNIQEQERTVRSESRSCIKGIEQRHLFLLFQSVTLSVIDCGLGLTTLSQSNLLKFDRVQNEAMTVVQNQQKTHPLRPCAT